MSPRGRGAPERHYVSRGGWLRASVLGANDGIVSTASLVLGVAAADADTAAILTAGVAGLVGGALSMAAGEYVSVSSQRDVERADLAREHRELQQYPEGELAELTDLYVKKGLDRALARQVAAALSAHDALAAHAREELNIDVDALSRPVQAALSSALSFALGAALPLAVMALAPASAREALTGASAVAGLAGLGVASARLGGTPVATAAVRVVLGGCAAMAVTMAIGALVGRAV